MLILSGYRVSSIFNRNWTGQNIPKLSGRNKFSSNGLGIQTCLDMINRNFLLMCADYNAPILYGSVFSGKFRTFPTFSGRSIQ